MPDDYCDGDQTEEYFLTDVHHKKAEVLSVGANSAQNWGHCLQAREDASGNHSNFL